jgi:hypothetical protein
MITASNVEYKDNSGVITGNDNYLYGSRSSWFETTNQEYHINIEWEGVTTCSPDFVFIADNKWNYDIPKETTVRYIVESSANAGFGPAETLVDSTLNSSALTGPEGRDRVLTFSKPTTDYAYHRVVIIGSNSTPWTVRIPFLIMCELFDFGRDPSIGFISSMDFVGGFQRQKGKRFSLTWEGITNAKLNEFRSLIEPTLDLSPIVLYETNDAVLQGDTALLCNVTRLRMRSTARDSNEVRIEVTETV